MEKDQEDKDVGAIFDMYVIVFLIIGLGSFWAGYYSANSALAKRATVTDCSPPQTEHDKLTATLKPKDGVLSLHCQSETIIPYGGAK